MTARLRVCNDPSNSGGCEGNSEEHEICNTDLCDGKMPNFQDFL